MRKINILKNKLMEEILEKYNGLNIKEGILPNELNKILEKGVIFDGQCLLLKSMVESSSHINQRDFHTLMEYESFVNHIHLDSYIKHPYLIESFLFLNELIEILKNNENEITIMFSIDISNLYPTCRFYVNRLKEGTMYVDDLEKYEMHGMLIVEILNN